MPFDELIRNKRKAIPEPRVAEPLKRAEPPRGKKISKGSRSLSLPITSVLMWLAKVLIALIVVGVVVGLAWWGFQLYTGEG